MRSLTRLHEDTTQKQNKTRQDPTTWDRWAAISSLKKGLEASPKAGGPPPTIAVSGTGR